MGNRRENEGDFQATERITSVSGNTGSNGPKISSMIWPLKNKQIGALVKETGLKRSQGLLKRVRTGAEQMVRALHLLISLVEETANSNFVAYTRRNVKVYVFAL